MDGRDDGPGSGPVDAGPCDVCGAAAMEPGLRVSLLGIRTANVHVCRRCRFAQVRPRLGDAEIAALYPSEYFLPGASGVGFRGYAREAQRVERDGYFLARKLSGLLPQGGRLLEIGCGLGFLLDALARFGPAFEAEGIDVSEFAARFARERLGLAVRAGTLEESRFPDGRFDVVLQKDLLEHVRQPREHLAETARILRPGGLLWLVTPNGDANLAPYAALAGREPERLPLLEQGHLSFFRKEHLERLLAEAGFEILGFKNLRLLAGLRALGRLPRDLSKFRIEPREGVSGPGPEPPVSDGEAAREETLDRMAAAVRERRSRLRGSRAYYWYRHLLREARNAPAFLPFGVDFEVLARKVAAAR